MLKEKSDFRGRIKNAFESMMYKRDKKLVIKAGKEEDKSRCKLNESIKDLEQMEKFVRFSEDIIYQPMLNIQTASVNRQRAMVKKWMYKKTDAEDRIKMSTSSTACYERLIDGNYQYRDVNQLLQDRATVEKFMSGKSFDKVIPSNKVMEQEAHVCEVLDRAKDGWLMDSKQDLKIVLAFADAQTLGATNLSTLPHGTRVTYGDRLFVSIVDLRRDELYDITKDYLTTDMSREEGETRTDAANKEFDALEQMAKVIVDSARAYYEENGLQQIEETTQEE